MRDEPDRFASRPGQHGDDVGDTRRAAQLRPPRIRLLNPHLEPEQLQLVDDVVTGARIGRGADGRLPMVPASMLT